MRFLARFRSAVLAAVVSAPVASASAQPDDAPPAETAATSGARETLTMPAPLSFDRVGLREGLPQASVAAIEQDQIGFVWLGTQDGLARYDGHRLEVYRRKDDDPSALSSGYISALSTAGDGRLWVGTPDALHVYDPETDRFTRLIHDPEDPETPSSDGVSDIHTDKKGRVWLAMSRGGLNRFEDGKIFHHLESPLDAAISSIAEAGDGKLWLGTADGMLIELDPETRKGSRRSPVPSRSGGLKSPVTAVLVDSKGLVWSGTQGEGVHVFDPGGGAGAASFSDEAGTLSDSSVTAIHEDQSGTVWVGTNRGLNRYDRETRRFEKIFHDPNDPVSMPHDWIASLGEDKDGTLWVGTMGNGLGKLTPIARKLNRYRTKTYAPLGYVEDAAGTLWVVTYNGGLYAFDREARKIRAFYKLTGGNVDVDLSSWLNAITIDRQGILWIAGIGQGLISFDPRTERYRLFQADADSPGALSHDWIFDLWEDADGALWVATWGGGLNRLNRARTSFEVYRAGEGSGLTSDHLYALHPDPEDESMLWVGAGDGGLLRLDRANKRVVATFRHDRADASTLGSDDVLSIHPDGKGTVWVGTHGGGLARVNLGTGEAERFNTSNGKLPRDVIWGVLGDDEGKLWLATNGAGLIHFDPATGVAVPYDSRDGLQDDFSQGSYYRAADGEMFFGGVGGFNGFFPKDLKTASSEVVVRLTGFRRLNEALALERPIWTLDSLELSYSDSFEVHFAALSFDSTNKLKYAYKLEGFDDQWIETDRPTAVFTKLAGGSYTLRVRAANRYGEWFEEQASIELAISPPLWRTWWAYSAYVLLLAGVVFAVVNYQRQKIKRLERENRLQAAERDLELTGAVQTGFLPQESHFNGDRVNVFGFYRPADQCGGDWWWYERLPGGRVHVLVGDVTGHGAGPAMVTASVATAFRVTSDLGGRGLDEKIAILNREVLRVAERRYQMTLAAVELDENTGDFVFLSAGSPPALALRQAGRPKVCSARGTPMGTEQFDLGRYQGQLEPGGRILLYTDGIPEITRPNGKMLGTRWWSRLYESTRPLPVGDAVSKIVSEAEQMLDGRVQDDDWTFAVLEWDRNRG